jgi:heme-binding NEAT domain protein
VTQMEMKLQQDKAQHHAGAPAAPHSTPAPGHATPPTPSPAKPSAPR